MSRALALARQLADTHNLPDGDLLYLLEHRDPEAAELLRSRAQALCQEVYGRRVFIRGLIEFTNFCKNDCYYCGIRKSNRRAQRYRLSREDILSCCGMGYGLGFRTFVLQGGEDPWFTDERLCAIVRPLRRAGRTAPSPFPWGSAAGRATACCGRPGPIGTCSATRPPPPATTRSSTRRSSLWPTGWPA